MKFILLLFLILIFSSCSTIDTSENTYQYTGVQCVDEPWISWYKKSGINFIRAPTEEELIEMYYLEKEVKINSIEVIIPDTSTCEACNICAKSYFHFITVDDYNQILKDDGWELI
jgi:hypothetical protein